MSTSMLDFGDIRARIQAGLFGGIGAQVERLSWNAQRIAAHQRDALRQLLARALAGSPFHRRRLSGIDPAHFEVGDLEKLPVMTKAQMMDELDDVLTDRRLSRARIEDTLAQTTTEPVALFGEYLCQATGGSSGRRGVFVSDVAAQIEFASALLRPTMARRRPDSGRLTIAMVGAASAVHATGIAPKILEGSPLRMVAAPATLPVPALVDKLNGIAPDALFGYPSMLSRLAVEQIAGRLRIAPRFVNSTSETLEPEHRGAIRDAFGAPVVDTFGSSEGLVGVSDPDDPVLTFASDLCIVELVDDRDHPVPSGMPSAKVLVTNLFNHTQPLIRYTLEDTFVRQPAAAHHGHLRATVQGRSDEVLRYEAGDIHPIVIRSVIVRTPAVLDYQVRQTPGGVDVAIVAEATLDPERLRGDVAAALAGAGLAHPEVGIRQVTALDRHAGTGKLRRFIPLR